MSSGYYPPNFNLYPIEYPIKPLHVEKIQSTTLSDFPREVSLRLRIHQGLRSKPI